MSKDIKRQEAVIGRKAAKMAENYLKTVLKQKLKIKNIGFPEGPILEDTTVKHKMGEYRLLGLNLSSSKTGFILHYGFMGVRSATSVYYKDSRYKINRAQRQRHNFNLPAKEIFGNIYKPSGSIDYLMAELSKTRKEDIQIRIDDLILKLNSDKDVK